MKRNACKKYAERKATDFIAKVSYTREMTTAQVLGIW